MQFICLEQTQEKIKINHLFGSLFKFCESLLCFLCEGVLFNLCEPFICDEKIQSLLFSFVLYVFLGKLFVKVFESASHSFGMEKQCFSMLFYY